jgi:glycerophosphoryl diester phosphodiesterase
LSSNASEWWAPRPLVIAHRGAARRAPENTLTAFRLAAELGADAIELDARLTADGEVVALHDRLLDRTTNGSGPVSERTCQELQALDAGAKFGLPFAGERIPTLDQVLEAVGGRLLINLELKNYETPFDRLVPQTVARVRAHGLQRRVLLSCFSPISLWTAALIAPEIPRALLLYAGQPRWMQAAFSRLTPCQADHPQDAMADAAALQALHRRGRRVNVWTVNHPERMRELLRLGSDGLITDAPELARQAVRDAGER